MKRITLNKFTDPGHGWYKIDIEKLQRLGLVSKISSYSFINNNHAYLEEDDDATLLFNRLEELGIQYRVNYYHSNTKSKLRGYHSYSADKAMHNYLVNLHNHLTS